MIIFNVLGIFIHPIYMAINEKLKIMLVPFALPFFLIIFLLNFVTIGFFFGMSRYYLKIMANDYEKEKKQFYAIIWITMIFIILANIEDNLYHFVEYLVQDILESPLTEHEENIWNIGSSIFSIFRSFLPFVTGSFIILIIRYVAKDAKANAENDKQEAGQSDSDVDS